MTGGAPAEPLDHSAIAELADVILVALGLRVAALVLYPPRPDGRPRMLVLADDLPAEDERSAYLTSHTPRGSLGDAEIVLRTPAEFLADPAEAYVELTSGARLLTDRRGIVVARLRELAGEG